MTTWHELITDEMVKNKDSWDFVEGMVIQTNAEQDAVDKILPESELDRDFIDGFGATAGAYFTIWTKTHVYFPACYDGAEWAASVQRHPNYNKATAHIGGG